MHRGRTVRYGRPVRTLRLPRRPRTRVGHCRSRLRRRMRPELHRDRRRARRRLPTRHRRRRRDARPARPVGGAPMVRSFADVPLEGERGRVADESRSERGEPWTAPEGIDIASVYTRADRATTNHPLATMPGAAPYLRGPYPTMYVNQP